MLILRSKSEKKETADRQTVDLSGYPELAVIYVGMRVNSLRGLKTLLSVLPEVSRSVADRPDGLLHSEGLYFSLLPPHVVMRQYWRDYDSLETWARSLPHRKWWQDYIRDRGGTSVWNEVYLRKGGMESLYIDLAKPIGMAVFAPAQPMRGAMFSARQRLGLEEEPKLEAALTEEDIYGSNV